MQRRKFTAGMAGMAGLWGLGAAPVVRAAGLTEGDAALGIRAALERGAMVAVDLLGRRGGFLDNEKVRIPLPGFLNEAAKLLKYTGQQTNLDELVTAMNRAAEAAVPQARLLLVNAAKVTEFFATKTRVALSVKFLPIVTRATEKVALADKYNAIAGKVAGLGLVSQDDANIQRYVTGKALDGLYLMIGEEERKIRKNPVSTGSAILSKVFGSMR